jgi:hypothetical protein
MFEEIAEHINGLIYYSFFYHQDNSYIDDIMESIKVQMEKELKSSLKWEDIDYSRLEKDICEHSYDAYYSEKELMKILKTMRLNVNEIEDIRVNIDIEDYKKRVIKFYSEDGLYLDYILDDSKKL